LAASMKQKIEELNQQLAALRQERNELNSQAKGWTEKRNSYHEQIRALQTEVETLREKRDRANLQVQVLKAAREKAKSRRKEKYEEILKTRKKLRTIAQKKPNVGLADLERDIQNLEWKIQTSSLSVKEEKTLVEEVQALETKHVVYRQLQELKDALFELQTETKAFATQAKLNHEKLSELAEQSQKFHERLVENINKIKNLKEFADEAHEKYVEFRGRADQTHEKYIVIQQQIKSLLSELEKREKEHLAKREEELRKEVTQKAQEKMRRGEKLTWNEFKLLTENEESTEP
jgi:phosphoserine phosphatase